MLFDVVTERNSSFSCNANSYINVFSEATPACVEFLGTYNDYDFYYLSEIFFLETGAEYNRYVVAINGEGATKIAVLEDMNFFVPNKHKLHS